MRGVEIRQAGFFLPCRVETWILVSKFLADQNDFDASLDAASSCDDDLLQIQSGDRQSEQTPVAEQGVFLPRRLQFIGVAVP